MKNSSYSENFLLYSMYVLKYIRVSAILRFWSTMPHIHLYHKEDIVMAIFIGCSLSFHTFCICRFDCSFGVGEVGNSGSEKKGNGQWISSNAEILNDTLLIYMKYNCTPPSLLKWNITYIEVLVIIIVIPQCDTVCFAWSWCEFLLNHIALCNLI